MVMGSRVKGMMLMALAMAAMANTDYHRPYGGINDGRYYPDSPKMTGFTKAEGKRHYSKKKRKAIKAKQRNK